ncbi:MAG: CRISPR-associated DxTHG motif protein [Spiroplasma sp. WSS]|nr:MAG: CRISPR-associated DxTHG motif protein [Spiroplasma sp. WSS]
MYSITTHSFNYHPFLS